MTLLVLAASSPADASPQDGGAWTGTFNGFAGDDWTHAWGGRDIRRPQPGIPDSISVAAGNCRDCTVAIRDRRVAGIKTAMRYRSVNVAESPVRRCRRGLFLSAPDGGTATILGSLRGTGEFLSTFFGGSDDTWGPEKAEHAISPISAWPRRDKAYPMVLAPSRDSRMMSAWPACWAVSAMMCSNAVRADQRAPGSNHGASGSGWAASRSGRDATSSSVRSATRRTPRACPPASRLRASGTPRSCSRPRSRSVEGHRARAVRR